MENRKDTLAEWVASDFEDMRTARKTLEDKWNRNLDMYNCTDESVKTWKKGEKTGWRSRTYVGMTRQKVMSAFSLITDMTLRGGRVPFLLRRERAYDKYGTAQIDEMVSQVAGEVLGGSPEAQYSENEVEQNTIPFPTAPSDEPGATGAVSLKPVDAGASGMEALINSQMDMGKIDRHYIKMVLSMCVFGLGWTKKGATRYVKRMFSKKVTDGMWASGSAEKLIPSVSFVPVWDVFWDMEAENLKECCGIAHRQMLSVYDIRQLKKDQTYLADNIDELLSEVEPHVDREVFSSTTVPASKGLRDVFGGDAYNLTSTSGGLSPSLRDIKKRKRNIEVVERWGRIPSKLAAKFEKTANSVYSISEDGEGDEDGGEVECVVTIACGKVIRYIRTRIEDRPFCQSVFEESMNGSGGVGLPDKLENEQMVLNGAVRAFEDNSRLSGDVILGVKRRYLIDNDSMGIEPGKLFEIAEECQDARQAMQQVIIQNVGSSYEAMIALFERYSEETSMIPRITQGQAPIYNKTNTAYEISQQGEKAGKYMASIIRNIDEGQIEEWVQYYYEWNMEDPDISEEIKGSYTVVPLGFTSYEDKVVRFQRIRDFIASVANLPEAASVVKMESVIRAIAETLDLEKDELLKTPEEMQAEAEMRRQEQEADMQRAADIQKTMAQTEKIKTDAQAKSAKIATDGERIRMEKARLVGDLAQVGNGSTSP